MVLVAAEVPANFGRPSLVEISRPALRQVYAPPGHAYSSGPPERRFSGGVNVWDISAASDKWGLKAAEAT